MYQPVDGPISYGAVSVGTTAVELKIGASPSPERKVMIVQSLGNRIYVGFDNTVTTSTGIEMSKRQTLFLEVSDSVNVWAIADSGTIDVRVVELG